MNRLLVGLTAPASVAAVSLLCLATPATAAGAIVVSPQNFIVWHTHAQDPAVAAELAMSRCSQEYGPGCRVLTTYEAGCMAVSVTQDGTHRYGYAIRPAQREASLVAIGNCAQNGNSCRIRELTCE